jgi:hypothetical protein
MVRTSFHRFLLTCSLLCSLPALVLAESVYVSDGFRLGTVDLGTGAFHQIGPEFPDVSQGLGSSGNGSLLTMGFTGNLNSINPATGVMTTVGPSGLSDCSTPSSPCASNSVNTLTSLNAQTFATDFENRLYSVNTATGAATLIGTTGMPAIPFIPLSENADGTFNIYDEAFFSADGRLYATFNAGRADFSTGEITPEIAGALYQIDPSTAHATLIGPTEFGIGGAAEVNGITYAFLNATGQIATFDLTTGRTNVIGTYDAGIISAAAPTPEPATTALGAFGLAIIAAAGWMRKRKVGRYS